MPAFNLVEARPWGRDLTDYQAFFRLADVPRGARILDCAAGPASFAAVMNARGCDVTAADPLYAHRAAAIARRIDETAPLMLEGLHAAGDRFLWCDGETPESHCALRRAAMARFLADYADPACRGRYLAAALPRLPFRDGTFDLALCSHFLFLYSVQLDLAFHLAAVTELLRVAREVRLFPLLDLDGRPSAHLPAVLRTAEREGFVATVERVPYEFQKGGNEMLRVTRRR